MKEVVLVIVGGVIMFLFEKAWKKIEQSRKRFVGHISTDKDKKKLQKFLEKYSNKGTVFYLNITLNWEMANELENSDRSYFTLIKDDDSKILVCFYEKEAIIDLTSTSNRIRGNFICDTSGTKQGISLFVLKLQPTYSKEDIKSQNYVSTK